MNSQEVMEVLKRELNLPDNTVAISISVGINRPLIVSCTYIHRPAPQAIKDYLRGQTH